MPLPHLVTQKVLAHVDPIEQWFSRNAWATVVLASLETVRNAKYQAHLRPIKSETLGVAQKSVFSQALQELLMRSHVCKPAS